MRIPFLNSLRFKIGFGYIVLVLINLAVTAWAIFNFARLTNALSTILNENLSGVLVAETMARSIERHEHALSSMLNNDLETGQKEFENAKVDFYQMFDKANENRSIPNTGAILDDIRRTYEGYLLVTDSLASLVGRGQIPKAKLFYGNIVHPFSQRLSDFCLWLVEENQKEMSRVAQQTKSTSDEAIIAVLIAAVVATGLSFLTMFQFTRRIIEPAEQLTDMVHQIGRGRLDLKIDITTNDEVGELSGEFNKMTERLRRFEEMNIETLVAEKRKSETIVESISDAIIVCDSASNIQLINHSAEELFGLREAEIIGRPVDECLTDERLRSIFANPGDPELANRPYLEFDHKGRTIYLRPRLSIIPHLHTATAGLVLILQDVTQYKELDKMKSDFMAAVSHEFRTPLTSINMSVDILRQKLLGPLTQAQADLLQSSKQDCERLTKLVRELLQLSKLESGKIELREDQVDIRRVIESTLEPLRLPFREKGVKLVVDVASGIPSLIGDEQQLSWVISNLVNNAIRYTAAGGSVTVSASRDGDSMLLKVIDTGTGIAPENLATIFDKFVQVKQSLNSTPGSVGLGLAIAKEIVEMYGGTIRVDSTVNRGSTFSVRLPLAQGAVA